MLRTRIVPIAALALVLAGCAAGDGEPPAGERASPAAAAPPAATGAENGTFEILKGDSAVATIRFLRTADGLQSEAFGDPAEERFVYTAALNPDGTVSRLQGRLLAAGNSTEPKARLEIVFRGDSAFMQSVEGGETQAARVQVPAGVIPIPISEAVTMAEQILRRARVLGGNPVTVPVLTLEDGAELGTATVTFAGADSARIQFGPRDGQPGSTSTELVAHTDSVGRLLGGRIPAQGYVIRRTP